MAAHDAVAFRHPAYAESLREFGVPRQLPTSGGWLLEREIVGSGRRDAMGVLPLLVLADWSTLCTDLSDLRGSLVSVTFVTDPFAQGLPSAIEACCDVLTEFKQHYVIDLSVPADRRISRHHWRQIRRSEQVVDVQVTTDPSPYLDEWTRLFSHMVERHRISGMRAFSRTSFEQQLGVPGAVMFRALVDDRAVAASLWLVDGDVAYGHLVGIAPGGYRAAAPYALIWRATEWFAGRCRWLDLGGIAGARHDASSGLAQFKAGWATETLPTYLCGVIGDPAEYERLAGTGVATNYFPAYRTGELL